MKKWIFLLVIFWSIQSTAQDNKPIRYEAENGQVENLILLPDSLASNLQFLRMQDKGAVIWKIDIQQSSWYNFIIRYRAFDGEKEQLIIKNGDTIPTGFPISKEWNTLKRAMALTKGSNTISISRSWGNMDIDYIEAERVDIKPEIVPIRNEVFLTQQRDLLFKWNAYGKTLSSVWLDDTITHLENTSYQYQEDSWISILQKEKLAGLKEGKHTISFVFDSGDTLVSVLNVAATPKAAPLIIIAPYVEHGSSVVIKLPSGKIMLVDCGKDWVRDQIIIPFLQKNNIRKIDYFIITHYHGDHDGGDKGEKIKKLFNVDHFIDYNTYSTGMVIPLEETTFKILNSSNDGTEENTKSLSFKISYNGFSYTHGADTYGDNQLRMLQQLPGDTRTDVFMANHHFHGSVNVDYLRKLDPVLVLIQAQVAIYARSAYMLSFREGTEKYWRYHKRRYLEALPTLEVGAVVIRVRNQQDWTYESHHNIEQIDLK